MVNIKIEGIIDNIKFTASGNEKKPRMFTKIELEIPKEEPTDKNKDLRGKDLDLEAATLVVNRTKNGDPITAGLSTQAVAELRRLAKVSAEELESRESDARALEREERERCAA